MKAVVSFPIILGAGPALLVYFLSMTMILGLPKVSVFLQLQERISVPFGFYETSSNSGDVRNDCAGASVNLDERLVHC